MRALRPILLLILMGWGALFVSSCAIFRSKDSEPDVFIRPSGTVIKVDPHQHFVVFESGFRFRPEQQVFAFRDGRAVARLLVHSQSRPPFYVADILEGRPAVDDLIE
ncbi:MAG: hypothetical protein JJU05_07260 [Verrucomicrobia bacterium]|nr:hypothetical protein [Verrucomicrobiota bacterium]MCH8526095.1 hypothetical protein [Kiritimatiellia bacterium]